MDIARSSEAALENLSKKLEEKSLLPEAGPEKDEERTSNRANLVEEMFVERGFVPAPKEQGTFRKIAGQTWGASKSMASYAGDAKGYYSMAENAEKFIVNDADASMVPAIGAAPLLVGAAAGVMGFAGALEGAIKSYSTATKAGFTSQAMGVTGAGGGMAAGGLNAAGAFVNKGLQQSFGTAASLIGIGTGVLLMTKATLDYRNEHVNLKKAADVLLKLKEMDNELIQQRDTNIEDIRNSLNKTDQQKQAAVAAEIEKYNNQVEKLMFMAKAAKLSIEDAKQKGGGIGRSFLGGILATGSSSAVAILGVLGSTGLALPGVLLGGAVIGTIMVGEGAIHADQIAEQQNRRYIDADMYADPKDQQRLMEEAEKNLKGDQLGDLQDLQLWEPDSDEDLKNKAMQKEAKRKSEVFQDQMRDLYAAQKGYVHQSSAKSGIKGKLFGEIYDRAFSEAQEDDDLNMEIVRDGNKRIRLNMQELLRSQGLNIHHNEGKPQGKQKQQISREKAVASAVKR